MTESEKKFTPDELKQFDGQNGRPAYIAYKGKVYDVTDDPLWFGGDHMGQHKAGTDLSNEILFRAPHGEEELNLVKLIGTLVSPGEKE